jgi:hypothetical protein
MDRPDTVRSESDSVDNARKLLARASGPVTWGAAFALAHRTSFDSRSRQAAATGTEPAALDMEKAHQSQRAERPAQQSVFIASESAVVRRVLAHSAARKGYAPVIAEDTESARSYLESDAEVVLLLHTADGIGLACRQVALRLCLLGRNMTILEIPLRPYVTGLDNRMVTARVLRAIDSVLDMAGSSALHFGFSVAPAVPPSAISALIPRILCHAGIALDVASDVVTVNDSSIHVPPIPLRILKYLLFNLGKTISERELMQNALQSYHDTDTSSIREHIRLLRHRLGESAGREIKTSRGSGYGIGVAEQAPRSRRRRFVSKI